MELLELIFVDQVHPQDLIFCDKRFIAIVSSWEETNLKTGGGACHRSQHSDYYSLPYWQRFASLCFQTCEPKKILLGIRIAGTCLQKIYVWGSYPSKETKSNC